MKLYLKIVLGKINLINYRATGVPSNKIMFTSCPQKQKNVTHGSIAARIFGCTSKVKNFFK